MYIKERFGRLGYSNCAKIPYCVLKDIPAYAPESEDEDYMGCYEAWNVPLHKIQSVLHHWRHYFLNFRTTSFIEMIWDVARKPSVDQLIYTPYLCWACIILQHTQEDIGAACFNRSKRAFPELDPSNGKNTSPLVQYSMRLDKKRHNRLPNFRFVALFCATIPNPDPLATPFSRNSQSLKITARELVMKCTPRRYLRNR